MNIKDTAEQISQYTVNMYTLSSKFYDTYVDLRNSGYVIDEDLLDTMATIYAKITHISYEMEDLCIRMTEGGGEKDE